MQKGRFREFHQFGLEAFGAQGPDIDAEIISVLRVFFNEMGLKSIKLCINSIGCPTCRKAYNDSLRDYFRPHLEEMCYDCKSRFEKNPLRMIDCKVPECKVIAANAPKLIDHLCDDCKAHFEGLKERLDNIGIEYSIDPNIVRGLDYYTRTVFEFVSENVGSQGTICGGGRYDGLVESMGGTAVPGIGFAMGVERFMLEANSQGVDFGKTDYVKVYLANLSDKASMVINKLAYELRLKGVGCEVDLCQRSFRAQMKYAGKAGIPYVVVIGDDELDKGEVSIKRMSDGTSNTVALSNFVEYCMNEL